jgi:hypothetical protein
MQRQPLTRRLELSTGPERHDPSPAARPARGCVRRLRRPTKCLESGGNRAVHTAVADFAAGKLVGDRLEKLIAVGGAQRRDGVGDRQQLALGKTDRHRRGSRLRAGIIRAIVVTPSLFDLSLPAPGTARTGRGTFLADHRPPEHLSVPAGLASARSHLAAHGDALQRLGDSLVSHAAHSSCRRPTPR